MVSDMAAVELAISKPAHGTSIVGSAAVDLQGLLVSRPAEIAGVPLYYRWYSSLHAGTASQMSINVAALADPATVYSPSVGVGTHVLTFAASDQPNEDAAAQNATQHGGVTGGSAGPTPCVVHVVLATVVKPAAGATLSRGGANTLEAQAPVQWDDAEYVKTNKLAFGWRLDPTPADGRASATLAPSAFDKSVTPAVLRYAGALPGALGLGSYRLTLRVSRTDVPAVAHEAFIPVVIAA
jgi:hypothetical protein